MPRTHGPQVPTARSSAPTRAALAVSDFDPAHALIVRPFDIGYQIVAGHHRFEAARRAGLDAVPCWVRDLDDEAAYMLLASSNTQDALSPLERGLHALGSGMDVKTYAASVGRARSTVHQEVYGAQVAASVPHMQNDLTERARHLAEVHAAPEDRWPALVTEMVEKKWTVEDTRNEVDKARREAASAERRRAQQDDKRSPMAELLHSVSLSEWGRLDKKTRDRLLQPDPAMVSAPRFNEQEGNAIEWAMWSWNPITGCLHDCPYCYAREIALSPRVAAVYPNGFEPTLRPRSLLAPRHMKVPGDATFDARYRNVFTGSMADIFGRWVPAEWIEAVLAEIRAAPDWNFLCLTKFPKRMAEFDIPPNAWMGTTVDLQARVAAAEAGFAKISATVKWLSCEPMLEPLRFKHLDRFDWIVIGGASRTAATPIWRPPFVWVVDLVQQARAAGVKVYFKTNLLHSRILELPFDAPIVADPLEAPAVFHYLGGKAAAA
jgi:protein gp37